MASATNKVIIIDSTSKVRNHIVGIMEFMGYEAIPVTEPEKWQSRFEKNEALSWWFWEIVVPVKSNYPCSEV